jgi:alpha-1,2-mannosyltransferase
MVRELCRRLPRAKMLTALLAGYVGLVGACVTGFIIAWTLRHGPVHLDFFGVWSWARFEIEREPALIYDHVTQQAFLLSLDPRFPVRFPFPYPPPYLFLIRPLGWLSYPVAQATWSTLTLAAYMVAVCAPAWRPQTVLLALLAPVTAINLLYGQNGFLTAALLVGGIRLAPSWPVLGGILLGLLIYKPQFGFLVVIALVAARSWRAAFAAGLTGVASVAASLVVFGLQAWTAWLQAMPDFMAIVDAERVRLLHLMPTALANALLLGASERLAVAVQVGVMAAAAAAVWFAFRPARPPDSSPHARQGRAAALAVASVLAAPYAFLYDLTLVAAAVSLIASAYWSTLSALEVLILGAAVLLPAGMFLDAVPPLAAAVHGVLLVLILLRLRGAEGMRKPSSGLPYRYNWT